MSCAPFYPNFFISGAPKCGTTALYSYLQAHPGVAMSTMKEPHFFSADMPGMRNVPDWAAYCALFAGATPGALTGEASTSTLQSSEAIPAIVGAAPETRFIALVRNPADMAESFHEQLYFNIDDEDVGDFERAWRLQEPRRQGIALPKRCREPRLLQYRLDCALGDQVERLFDLVAEERRLVLVFDDLRENPLRVYRQVLAFLELPDDGRLNFEPVNASKRWRSKRFADFQRRFPARLGPLRKPLRKIGRRLRLDPTPLLTKLNRIDAPRPPIRPEFREELLAEFQPQVTKLSRLLRLDLSHWRND